jgi:hypothetical protein
LLFASPTFGLLVKPPEDQQFSELYLLGTDNMFYNYPNKIAVGQNYSLFIGVGNHLHSAAYYNVYVKLVNQKDFLPNASSQTPSPELPIYEYKFFLPEGGNWEEPLVFSISKATTYTNESTINQLLINGVAFNVNKYAFRGTNSSGFYYGLLCELWVYNTTLNTLQFNNRYTNLGLNLMKPI